MVVSGVFVVAWGGSAHSFHYDPGNRRDPFFPLELNRTKGQDQTDGIQSRMGMVKLLGIMSGKDGIYALLSTEGGNHIVSVGSVLGHGQGVVKEITEESVIIQERHQTEDGSVRLVERVLALIPMKKSE